MVAHRGRIWSGVAAAALLALGSVTGCTSSTREDAGPTANACAVPDDQAALTATPTGAPQPQNSSAPRDLSLNPEIASGYRGGMTPVSTRSYAVSTANPIATEAACAVLAEGGTAADALVTAQLVLGLVEPQASGIGGGAFLLYYDAAAGAVEAYDGRETAPAAATENYLRWISDTDRTEPKPDARASGRSIGVPGVLRMLELAHREHGKTAWRELFDPAIALADRGFAISPRLAAQIAESATELALDENAR